MTKSRNWWNWFTWEFFFQMRAAFLASIYEGRREQGRQLSFWWKTLNWIGHHGTFAVNIQNRYAGTLSLFARLICLNFLEFGSIYLVSQSVSQVMLFKFLRTPKYAEGPLFPPISCLSPLLSLLPDRENLPLYGKAYLSCVLLLKEGYLYRKRK